jgi:hypothetical protein
MATPEATNLPPECVVQGMANFSVGVERLLEQKANVGMVVVRGCFDASSIDVSERYLTTSRVLPDIDEHKLGLQQLQTHWGQAGYADKSVNQPLYLHRRRRNGNIATDNLLEYSAAMVGFASLSGVQTLYAAPAPSLAVAETKAVSVEALTAHEQRAAYIAAHLQQVPTEGTFRAEFPHFAVLKPGDVALVMGHPNPAHHRIRGQKPSRRLGQKASEYITFRYGLSRKRS